MVPVAISILLGLKKRDSTSLPPFKEEILFCTLRNACEMKTPSRSPDALAGRSAARVVRVNKCAKPEYNELIFGPQPSLLF
jgi:hypothetical protein